jgi:membrane-associated protease RseP (regulator of RpoE activity)
MTRITVPSLVALLVLSCLSVGGKDAAPSPQPAVPAPAPAAASADAPQSTAAADIGRLYADAVARGARASVFWGPADGEQKAVQYIQSRRAHQDAIVSIKQCQGCHDGLANYLNLIDPHGAGLTLRAPSGPWVGVSVGPADDVLRAQLKLPEGTGVVVTKVVDDGPAGQAGVAEHDILLSVNGQRVPTGDALDEIVRGWKQDGPPLTMRLLREGQSVEKQVTPSVAAPRDDAHAVRLAFTSLTKYRIGVNVSEPDDTLRKQLKLGDAGVVVTAVAENSPAAKQGVKINDVLVSADGKMLANGQKLQESVQHAAESPVVLELLRGGVTLRITVTPEQDPTPTEANLALELNNLVGQQRELMLVHPGLVYDFAAGAAPATQPSAPPQPSPGGAAERLDRLSAQVEELRNTVNSLRDELKETRTPREEKR